MRRRRWLANVSAVAIGAATATVRWQGRQPRQYNFKIARLERKALAPRAAFASDTANKGKAKAEAPMADKAE